MATTLYKNVNGKIESTEVDAFHVQGHIDAGWSGSEDCSTSDAMDIKELRSAAKDAGIEGYDTKRANTLVKELSALSE